MTRSFRLINVRGVKMNFALGAICGGKGESFFEIKLIVETFDMPTLLKHTKVVPTLVFNLSFLLKYSLVNNPAFSRYAGGFPIIHTMCLIYEPETGVEQKVIIVIISLLIRF